MSDKAKIVNWGGLTLAVNDVIAGKASAGAGENLSVPVKGTATTTGTTSVLEDSAWGTLRTTVLQLTNFVVGTSGDDGNLALGASLFTLPAGDLIVEQAVLKGALTADISVTTDTPEMGLGNVVATGVQATLGAVDAGCENIAGPFVATAVDGEDVDDGGATESGLLVQAADSHVVYLNVADGWADVTAAGDVTFTGYVVLKYRMV